MRSILIALVVGITAACGGGSLTDMEGIYTIDAWNENPTSCADPGPSVLAGRATHFYIKTEDIVIAPKFVNMHSCDSLAVCEMEARDSETIFIGEFGTFEDGSDDAGWTARNAFAFSTGGMCQGSLDTEVLRRDATGVVLRRESIDVMFMATPADECPDEAIEAAAVGQPCTSLEIVHGTFVEDI